MRKSLVMAVLALGVTTLSYGFDGSGSDGRESGERAGQRTLKVFQYEWASDLAAYLSSDCSGTPLITSTVSQLRPSQIIRQGVDATLYIAGDTYSAQTTFMSFNLSGRCLPGDILEAWSPESSYSLTQHYPEPLTIHY